MRGNNISDSKGFSLMESMLVLSLISIVLSVTVLNLSASTETKLGEQFSEQLSNDLLFAQQYALSTKTSVNIIFTPKENYYRIRQGTFQIQELVYREYHRDIRIDTRTMGERLTYNGNGSINKAGAIGIYVEGMENYQYVFTLGKGRFYVEKL
ncbi:competence type IV pilus minor pilin ComGD [Sutcliffiella horikoshii]|uniref:competence type IV pilus minor pilin ComGD n=1 Tax=Sutcliffiella horikoshii TaxID=79883 RepID=UPI0025597CD8|nr:competence type IV pilus minor pilin ComGD [Sutcliffiella horikoshii]